MADAGLAQNKQAGSTAGGVAAIAIALRVGWNVKNISAIFNVTALKSMS
jgi:hypothetical protein